MERGVVTLIACTTENPSFRVQSALLSRCKVFVLESLSVETLHALLRKTIQIHYADLEGKCPDEVLSYLASMADGDARKALNTLEMTMNAFMSRQAMTQDATEAAAMNVDIDCVKSAGARTSLVYDKGDGRYDLISAWHKSTRGSDANAALYYLGRMLEGGEDPLYIARRMVRCASEDIGLADNAALPLVPLR